MTSPLTLSKGYDLLDLSAEPAELAGLSSSQRERLATLLDRYLTSVERGEPCCRADLVAENPDLAGPLEAFLDDLDALQAMAAEVDASQAGRRAIARDNEDEAARAGEGRIGDFRVLREIGRGGMGVVYEAEQISLSRRVALKVLPFAAMLDPRQVARFRNEAQAAAQLEHPHIVPVYAVGVDRGVHYYAMRFIEGQPLDGAIAELRRRFATSDKAVSVDRDSAHNGDDETLPYPIDAVAPRPSRCAIGGPRRVAAVVELAIQAATALHAAHEVGIVHRDVKPSNLLLDADGKLWITDFGLARCQTEASLTRTGDLLGTLRYMSPEQAGGRSAEVDRRTDVYSLGATLYELLALAPAFAGDDVQSLLHRIAHVEPRPLRAACRDVPVDLQTVIAKAMAKHPGDRYATAEEFADDLRRIRDGKPTRARPPSLWDRAVRAARRHTRLVLATTAVSTLAAIGLGTALLFIDAERQNADHNFARAERYFRGAHETVDRFGARMAERLAAIPAASGVRRELLRETLAYYRGFAAEAQDDPGLKADLALTYSKIGTLADEIGMVDDAVAAHRDSARFYAELSNSHPDDLEFRRRLALAQNNLATTLSRTSERATARDFYDTAVDLQRALVASQPAHRDYRRDLAVTLGNLGLYERDSKHVAAAEAALREAVGIQEDLRRDNAGDFQVLADLASSYNNLSGLLAERQPPLAEAFAAKALAIQRQLLAAQPDDARRRGDLALTLNNLAATCSRRGDVQSAASYYREAVELQERLVRVAPGFRSYRQQLAVTTNNLGLAQLRLGQPDAAESSFRRATNVQSVLAKRYAADVEVQATLGGMYNNLGIAREGLRDPRGAAEAYARAIEHQRVAFQASHQADRYREYLSKHLYNSARVQRQLGDYGRATTAAVERRALWQGDARRLLSVAEELAAVHQALMQPVRGEDRTIASARQAQVDACASLVSETLRQATAAGLPPNTDLREVPAFASLRHVPQLASFFRDSSL